MRIFTLSAASTYPLQIIPCKSYGAETNTKSPRSAPVAVMLADVSPAQSTRDQGFHVPEPERTVPNVVLTAVMSVSNELATSISAAPTSFVLISVGIFKLVKKINIMKR